MTCRALAQESSHSCSIGLICAQSHKAEPQTHGRADKMTRVKRLGQCALHHYNRLVVMVGGASSMAAFVTLEAPVIVIAYSKWPSQRGRIRFHVVDTIHPVVFSCCISCHVTMQLTYVAHEDADLQKHCISVPYFSLDIQSFGHMNRGYSRSSKIYFLTFLV